MARVLAPRNQRRVLTGFIVFLLILFVVLKTEFLATSASRIWRSLTGQDIALASPADLAWIGFSFVAFRLIHTLRDRQTGILTGAVFARICELRHLLSFVHGWTYRPGRALYN